MGGGPPPPDEQREPVFEPAEHAAQRPLGQGGRGQLDCQGHAAEMEDDSRYVAGVVVGELKSRANQGRPFP